MNIDHSNTSSRNAHARGTGGVRLVWIPAAIMVAAAAATVGLALSDAAGYGVLGPGAFVQSALPIAVSVHHLTLAAVVGCLVFAAIIIPRHREEITPGSGHRSRDRTLAVHTVQARLLKSAAAASMAWTLSAAAVLVLSYARIIGQSLSDEDHFTSELGAFVTDIPAGRAWLAIVTIAAIVTTLTLTVRSPGPLILTTVLAVSAVIPMSLTGHAGASEDYYASVSALALHWLGVLLWVGGVAALAVVSPLLAKARPSTGSHGSAASGLALQKPVLERFSTLAAVAFFLVLVSGIINSILRLGTWEGLFTPYGQLILIKTAATLILGTIGFAHRKWAIPASAPTIDPAGRLVWQLITVEILIMAAVIGVAVALSGSSPPAPPMLIQRQM